MLQELRAAPMELPTIKAKSSRELLVEHLREGILSGRYGAHRTLPLERELVLQTGLSRGSVREALRSLEAEGLIATKVGRNGGSTVTRPSGDLFKRQITTFVQTHRVPLPQLVEVREALEPKMASLAARNRTQEDIAALQASLERMGASVGRDLALFMAENTAWHLAVAMSSRNEALSLFMEPVSDMVSSALDHTAFDNLTLQAQILKAHQGITKAIADGDGDAAARRMMRHVQAYPEQGA